MYWISLRLFLLGALVPALALAGPPVQSELITIHSSLADSSFVGKARLYRGNHKKPAVLLFHGSGNTYGVFAKHAERLNALGYTVLLPNLRGHGTGSERSVVTRYSKGDYSFQKMLDEDVVMWTTYLRDNLKIKKVFGGGFSLGAILAQSRAKLFDGLVLYGFPSDIGRANARVRMFGPILHRFRGWLPRHIPLIEGMAAHFLDIGAKAFPLSSDTIFDGRVMSEAEILEYMKTSVSDRVHRDYVQDTILWAKEGPRFAVEKGNPPVLMFSGERDGLADAAANLSWAYEMRKEGNIVKHRVFGNCSHIEVTAALEAIAQSVEDIDLFIKNHAAMPDDRFFLLSVRASTCLRAAISNFIGIQ